MPPPSAQLFAEHFPVGWMQHCLTLSAHATVRRHRLPGDMVIWMVVPMAFSRDEPVTGVVRRLNLSADGEVGMNLLARRAWGLLRMTGWPESVIRLIIKVDWPACRWLRCW